MLFMPGNVSTSDKCETAVKVVAVPKPGAPFGLPGVTLLFDAASGKANAIVNSSELTGLRTALVCLANTLLPY